MIIDRTPHEQAVASLVIALGPELAARLGLARIESIVAHFQRGGLSLEQVDADASSIAAGLRLLAEIDLRFIPAEGTKP